MRALTRLILPMVVVSAMTSGCGAFDPRLIINGGSGTDGPGAEVMLHDTVARRPYSLGGWDMCLDRPGSVTITRVELIKPYNDIVLRAFSSRPHTGPMLGNAEKPLTELGLQYAKTGDATAGADGVRITYTSAGRQRTVDFSLRVLLCAPGDTERCREAYEGLSTTSDDD